MHHEPEEWLTPSQYFSICHSHTDCISGRTETNISVQEIQHWHYLMLLLIQVSAARITALSLPSSSQPSSGTLHLNLLICTHSLSHEIVIQLNPIPFGLKYLFCAYYVSSETVPGPHDQYPRHGPWLLGNSLISR